MLDQVRRPQAGSGRTVGLSIVQVYFALAIASIVAYLLASEALRNFFMITLPQLAEKFARV